MNKCLRITRLILPLLLLPFTAQAVDWNDSKGQVHGFFTQGLVASTNNNWYGKSSDRVSFDFREIGFNGSYRLTPGILLSAQVISRRAGEMDDGELWVDYAFTDLTLFSKENYKAGVRLGRMKNPYGLYTDTRDVAFTRPGAIVPQPIYFDRSRKFALSGDGIHLYGNAQVPGGNIDATLGIVKLPINDRSSKSILAGPNAQGKLEQSRMTIGARILYETDDKRWLGGLSYFTLDQNYQPVPGDTVPPTSAVLEPWILSLQYSGEQWIVTGEYSQRNTEFTRANVLQKNIGENWYVQGQYRLMPQWELLLRYDSAASERDDPNGKQFAATTGGKAYTRYARDWVAGIRYDATPNFMLRAELHHVKGTVWLSSLENPVAANIEQDWNMLMLLGSYHF